MHFIASVTLPLILLWSVHFTIASHSRNCAFPFVFNGKTYHSCTKQNSRSSDPWCSLDHHFKGRWKSCDEKDLKNNPPDESAEVKNLQSTVKNAKNRMEALEKQVMLLLKQVQDMRASTSAANEKLSKQVQALSEGLLKMKRASGFPAKRMNDLMERLVGVKDAHSKKLDSYKSTLHSILKNQSTVDRRLAMLMSLLSQKETPKSCDLRSLLSCNPETKDCPLKTLGELISKGVAETVKKELQTIILQPNPLPIHGRRTRGG